MYLVFRETWSSLLCASPIRGVAVSAQPRSVSPMVWKWPFLCCFLYTVAVEAEAEDFQFSGEGVPFIVLSETFKGQRRKQKEDCD